MSIELPSPDGVDSTGPWWRMSSGYRVYAIGDRVFDGDFVHPDVVEQDALALLAAARWTTTQTHA